MTYLIIISYFYDYLCGEDIYSDFIQLKKNYLLCIYLQKLTIIPNQRNGNKKGHIKKQH